MGIYSAEAAEVYKENSYNPDAAGLLEFSINSQRAEFNMFETMLEMDFNEYYMESGRLVLTEADKENSFVAGAKKIWAKIVEAISKLIETLDKFLIKIRAWIASRVKSNKAVLKKYPKPLNYAAVKSSGRGDIEVELVNLTATNTISDKITKLGNAYNAVKTNADKYGKGFDATADSYKSEVDEMIKSTEAYFSKSKINDLGNRVTEIEKYMSENGFEDLTKAIIGSSVEDTVKKLKDLRNELKGKFKESSKAFKSVNKDKEASDEAKGAAESTRNSDAAAYKFVSVLNSSLSKVVNFGTKVAIKAMIDYRNAYIKIAIAASHQAKADVKVNKESVEEFDYDAILEYAMELTDQEVYENASFA